MIKRISIENFKSIGKIAINTNEENDKLICIIEKNDSCNKIVFDLNNKSFTGFSNRKKNTSLGIN